MHSSGHTSGRLNALIAEGEKDFRTALALTARGIGLNTYEASYASEAVEMLSSVEIHALVIDAELPDFGGLQAVRMVRTFAQVPPFLLVAREVTRSLRAQAMEQEAVSLLGSPVDMVLFSEILQGVLSRRYGDRVGRRWESRTGFED